MKNYIYIYILVLFFSCSKESEKVSHDKPFQIDNELKITFNELPKNQAISVNKPWIRGTYGIYFKAVKDSLILFQGNHKATVQGYIIEKPNWTSFIPIKPDIVESNSISFNGNKIECITSFQLIVESQDIIEAAIYFDFYLFEGNTSYNLKEYSGNLEYDIVSFLESTNDKRLSKDTFQIRLDTLEILREPIFEYKSKIKYVLTNEDFLIFELNDKSSKIDSSYFENHGIEYFSLGEIGNLPDSIYISFKDFKYRMEVSKK